MPSVVRRADWGARPARQPGVVHHPRAIVVHHTSEPTAAHWTGKASMRSIQSYHIDTRQWADIGYHFVIAPDGTVYEGRPVHVVGAHAPPNTGRLGVCLVGNFEHAELVTPAQYAALLLLVRGLVAQYTIVPANITGHRDSSETDCPGSSLYAMLPDLRKAATT
jgi:N-acetyl-anhydromuramyl-L-alanine amidase AmpD